MGLNFKCKWWRGGFRPSSFLSLIFPPHMKKRRRKAVALVIFGGLLLNISFGYLLTWGNVDVYIFSYLRISGMTHWRYEDATWVWLFAKLGQALLFPLGAYMDFAFKSPRIPIAIGCLFGFVSLFCSSFVLGSMVGLCWLYGLFYGMALGIVYLSPMITMMRWFPNHLGLITALRGITFTAGAGIFNQIQTAIVNPSNVEATPIPPITGVTPPVGKVDINIDSYFDNSNVIENVPHMIRSMAGIVLAFQIIGILFTENPETFMYDEKKYNQSKMEEKIKENTERKKYADRKAAREGKGALDEEEITDPLEKPLLEKERNIRGSVDEDKEIPLDDEKAEIQKKKEIHMASRFGIYGGGTISRLVKRIFVDFKDVDESASDDEQEGEPKTQKKQKGVDVHPTEVLRSFRFWLLFVMLIFHSLGNAVILTFWKILPLNTGHSDFALTWAGFWASWACAFGGLFWGAVLDVFPLRIGFALLSAVGGVALGCLPTTANSLNYGVSLFMFILMMAFVFVGGSYAMFAKAAAVAFGPRYFGIHLSLLFSAELLGGLAAATIYSAAHSLMGYHGLFFVAMGGVFFAGLLAVGTTVFDINLEQPLLNVLDVEKQEAEEEEERIPEELEEDEEEAEEDESIPEELEKEEEDAEIISLISM